MVRPDVDTTAEPLMDVNKVRALLPHRPPFLLVDKIYEVTDDIVIGCKNVTMNEPFFVGHFPEEPGNAGCADRGGDGAVRGDSGVESGGRPGELLHVFRENRWYQIPS